MDGPLSRPRAVPPPGATAFTTVLTELHDARRARLLPPKLYLPDSPPRGLILFSHGLGGSREGGSLWLSHWAHQGLAGLAVQHPGSDATLLAGASPLALRRALRNAMTPEALTRRAEDLAFVLTRIGHDTALPPSLHNIRAIGLCGHSFGAVTVQLLAGERRPCQPAFPADPRVHAALALSPSARQVHAEHPLATRFGNIRLPFLSITGTRDDGMGPSDITAAQRELPYRHMPPGKKYLLVFEGGTHLDFAGQASTAERGLAGLPSRLPPFHDRLLNASSAFWHAHLAGDTLALNWLDNQCRAQLRPNDRFETK
ncbi:hypothetical protein [Zoogloea sp.]|uniref:alpha/beta hydrolase family protein n=1 Tax=Zoogloea sp. TaxID=49181 RepID=UPI002639CA29|nr:hypothetical protein [Zoogloea sp.]MDD3354320.1 hypothetical protein [Zoogloea sp.]